MSGVSGCTVRYPRQYLELNFVTWIIDVPGLPWSGSKESIIYWRIFGTFISDLEIVIPLPASWNVTLHPPTQFSGLSASHHLLYFFALIFGTSSSWMKCFRISVNCRYWKAQETISLCRPPYHRVGIVRCCHRIVLHSRKRNHGESGTTGGGQQLERAKAPASEWQLFSMQKSNQKQWGADSRKRRLSVCLSSISIPPPC